MSICKVILISKAAQKFLHFFLDNFCCSSWNAQRVCAAKHCLGHHPHPHGWCAVVLPTTWKHWNCSHLQPDGGSSWEPWPPVPRNAFGNETSAVALGKYLLQSFWWAFNAALCFIMLSSASVCRWAALALVMYLWHQGCVTQGGWRDHGSCFVPRCSHDYLGMLCLCSGSAVNFIQ